MEAAIPSCLAGSCEEKRMSIYKMLTPVMNAISSRGNQ